MILPRITEMNSGFRMSKYRTTQILVSLHVSRLYARKSFSRNPSEVEMEIGTGYTGLKVVMIGLSGRSPVSPTVLCMF